MKRRQLVRELRKLGYMLVRAGGNHDIFADDRGTVIPVPRHTEIGEVLARKILKQAKER